MQQTIPSQRSIRFSGRSFMAFVLAPQPPVADWLGEFDEFAARSPGFFAGRPVVVDVAQLPPTRPDLVHIVTELKRRNITIMGLDGRTPGELGADARGLPPILSGGKEIAGLAQLAAEMAREGGEAPEEPAVTPAPEGAAEETRSADNLVVAAPVRSGQSIVHLTGDVTVVGQVASGSEIVAGGSIHVYGALRGRAIAGSKGNRASRIFCQALHAELVAIDGLYKTADDLDRAFIGRPVHAWLDGEALKLAALN